MLSLSKLLTKPVINLALNNSARTIFTQAYFSIDKFKSYSERIKQENGNNLEKLRGNLNAALSKPDIKLFPDDVKLFLYQTKTDEDLNLLIDAIKRYNSQSSLSLFNFNFESPLMRLLYVLNKTDKALDLFYKEEFFSKSPTVISILMNKLLEDKKIDEAIKVGIKYTENAKITKPEQKSPFLNDIVILFTQALLEKNDADALEQAKIMAKKLIDVKLNIPARIISNIAYLALEQKKPDIAYEVLNNAINESSPLIANIKISSMIDLNRVDDAVKLAEELSKRHRDEPKRQVSDRHFERLYYRSVLDKLTKAVENNEELKKRVQTLADKVVQKKMFQLDDDIKTDLTRLIDIRSSGSSINKSAGDFKQNQNNRYQNNRNQPFQQRQSFNQRQPYNNNNNNNNSMRNNSNNEGGFRRQFNQEDGQQQPQQQTRVFNDRRNIRQ